MIDIYKNFYKGKLVLVTGHTGFKGSWLSIWLHELGTEVVGVGLDPFSEREPLERLVAEGELMSYIHEGFWQCMDNIREKNLLEGLLANGTAPWKKWKREIPKY